jgi:hypothetical protein
MHSIHSKAHVRVIKGRNAGRCGRVVARHTYPAHVTNTGEIQIASVRINGVPTQWYRCDAEHAEIVEVSAAEAERSENGPRAAA